QVGDPGAATLHMVSAAIRPAWVFLTILVAAVPVLAPLPDVPVHVAQAPGVRREVTYRGRRLPRGVVAVVVGLVPLADGFAEVERRGRARPAGVLPFGLRRQAEPLARLLAQSLHELLAVVPG